ncbi:hypothetical protein [Bdellovibrio bacteriovorus]|uniref:hypothetical protein n=1 Tax=Bdellovibrio bacteriovorus TaxID=959 RepID=UPI0035A82AEC
MKHFLVIVSLSLISISSWANLKIKCTNWRTIATFNFTNDRTKADVLLHDKEGFVTKGAEMYELFFDEVKSQKGGVHYVTSNDDYLITFAFPKMILSKTPRKEFAVEFTPYFDGLNPRYNTLECKVK